MAIIIPSFYIIFYSVSSIVHAALKLKTFDPKSPFNFKLCCLKSSNEQATGISVLVTYAVSTILFTLVTLQRFWDHTITLTIIHIFITAIVMQEFPTNWQWWIAVLIGFAIMLTFGEVLCYCIQKKKNSTPEPNIQCNTLT